MTLPSQPASTAPLSQDTEHVNQALARLIEQYVGKPRVEALLSIFVNQVQDLEDALWQLATERFVDTAIGAQLNVLGEIVGQDRQGLSDDDYRALIRARIKANNSEGTIPDVYSIALAAVGGTWDVRIDQKFPAAFLVVFEAAVAINRNIINRLIRDGTAAGVRSITVFAVSDVNQMRFEYASNYPVTNAAIGFDSANVPGSGLGQFGDAQDELST